MAATHLNLAPCAPPCSTIGLFAGDADFEAQSKPLLEQAKHPGKPDFYRIIRIQTFYGSFHGSDHIFAFLLNCVRRKTIIMHTYFTHAILNGACFVCGLRMLQRSIQQKDRRLGGLASLPKQMSENMRTKILGMEHDGKPCLFA